MKRRIMKRRGVGYVSVFILATILSWILGRVTGLDWNFRDFILDFYVYILLGCIVFDAVTSVLRRIRGGNEKEDAPVKAATARTTRR